MTDNFLSLPEKTYIYTQFYLINEKEKHMDIKIK